eukprot:scaffold23507_cov63-Phaeocystis_antarctica.AAC.4
MTPPEARWLRELCIVERSDFDQHDEPTCYEAARLPPTPPHGVSTRPTPSAVAFRAIVDVVLSPCQISKRALASWCVLPCAPVEVYIL